MPEFLVIRLFSYPNSTKHEARVVQAPEAGAAVYSSGFPPHEVIEVRRLA